MSATVPTYDEILSELERLNPVEDGDHWGTREWSEHWGCSVDKARKIIRRCILEGIMQPYNIAKSTPMEPNRKRIHLCYKVSNERYTD